MIFTISYILYQSGKKKYDMFCIHSTTAMLHTGHTLTRLVLCLKLGSCRDNASAKTNELFLFLISPLNIFVKGFIDERCCKQNIDD